MKIMGSENCKPGKGDTYTAVTLSSGGEVLTSDDVGTKGLGYMAWGSGNKNPNVVSLLREASPYTASAHRFNVDLCEGRGPRFVYAYTQYVGGNITEKRIAFKDAGILIKGWIRDLKRELSNIEHEPLTIDHSAGAQNNGQSSNIEHEPLTIDHSAGAQNNGPLGPTGRLRSAEEQESSIVNGQSSTVNGQSNDDLASDIRAQIEALEADYKKWQETNIDINGDMAKGIKGFVQRNNLHLTYLSLVEDMQDQNICFPELLLQQSATDENDKTLPTTLWKPKVVSIRYRSAHTCRLERKDKEGRINYVYVSNQWYSDSSVNMRPEDIKIDAIPALDPQCPITDMERIIRQARQDNVPTDKRPTHFILPIAYPSAGRPYYPIPAWQSIFSGDIYEYLMTMVSDRNKRRKNSNVIGRVLYLNNEYMERLYYQKKADTPEDKTKVFNKLRNQINSFLEDRDNTGKPLVAYTFQSQADGKTYESWKIVEIEANNKQTAEANQKELAEISSIVFFAFGLDSRLVGNSPGDVASSGGTDLRERFLLKQVQMSPMQQLLLLPLYVAKYINGWDDHLEIEIPREVLTTLDNSKTGITNAEQPT